MWKGCVDDRGMTTRGMIVTYSQWLLRLMAALLCWQEAVHFHFHPAEESQQIKISTLLIPINHPLIFHPTSALLSQLKSPIHINGPGRTTAHGITNSTAFLPDSQEAIWFMFTGLGWDLSCFQWQLSNSLLLFCYTSLLTQELKPSTSMFIHSLYH